VYADFAEYVGERPLVAYNLDYDLDKVLRPEWQRLGLKPIGQAGFCALRLTQRLLDPVPAGNHKLQTLRQFYRLPQRGAHTALGDVETVVDLMQKVLRPLAEARGLSTLESLRAFADAPWFPARIAFGKFKGRPFRAALDEPALMAWLEWLAASSNPHSVEMGRWYLAQLHEEQAAPLYAAPSDSTVLQLYRDPELETLRRLVAEARTRLAELEAEYTQEHHAVEVIRSQIFLRLRPHYQQRDALRLAVLYRRQYLDTLLVAGEEEAESVTQEHDQAQAEAKQEYEEAATQAADQKTLSQDEEQELKDIYRKLARLYHPDRYASEPEKQETYNRLMQAINKARDEDDIATLREIANDPNGFLFSQGLTGLDFDDDVELAKLRPLYDTLQARILDALASLENLRKSSDYDLYLLSKESPIILQEVADKLAEEISTEIMALTAEAAQLAVEIESLTGSADHFGQKTSR
jgi:DNA polymerase-3 subunit epsilon